jgi:hypothetical protein
LEVVEVGVGESKQKRFLSLPGEFGTLEGRTNSIERRQIGS